jgi:photosystem II stability/assembly factor-like uncharacterized protein
VKKVLILTICLLAHISVAAQWKSLRNSPGGYAIYDIAASGNIVVASKGGDISVSTDNGETWQKKPDEHNTECIATDGSIIIAGGNGIYRTTDLGATWTNQKPDINVNNVAMNQDYIVAGTINGDLYLSTDKGDTWKSVDYGMYSSGIVYSIGIKGNMIVIATGVGVFISADAGKTWSSTTAHEKYDNIRHVATNGKEIIATNDDYLLVSTDNGETWTEKRILFANFAAVALVENTALMAIRNKGFAINYIYSSFGAMFYNSGINNVVVTSMAVSESSVFVGTSIDGIFRADLAHWGLTGVGDDTLENESVSFAPNPADATVTIHLPEATQYPIRRMEILSVVGSTVEKIEIPEGTDNLEIDVTSLPNGIYSVLFNGVPQPTMLTIAK